MRRENGHEIIPGAVTIRRLGPEDAAALARLVELDSGDPLEGPVLGAEIEGVLLAAISVKDGATLSDPFSRTAELRSLLELRAAQLRRREGLPTPGTRFAIRTPARATTAASPPGAGGRLLTLLPRF